jgi:hypothetical protein
MLLAALAAAALAGCGRPRLRTKLASENPAERVEACIMAAEKCGESDLPLLVERLDDPDADVRFFAFLALRKISGGKTFGYEYYDDPAERLPAVRQWRQWLRERPGDGGRPSSGPPAGGGSADEP